MTDRRFEEELHITGEVGRFLREAAERGTELQAAFDEVCHLWYEEAITGWGDFAKGRTPEQLLARVNELRAKYKLEPLK